MAANKSSVEISKQVLDEFKEQSCYFKIYLEFVWMC